ncbi:MAG TPA: hypothetical protein VFU51_02815 [Gaiellaceae bacterium]|nr:hypothetical protein [Gaiellaceae bacterium]
MALGIREHEPSGRRPGEQLLTEQSNLDLCEVHPVLALVLRKLSRDRHRPAFQVEHVVGQTEPERLTRTHLARKQDETRHVLGEPGSELVQLQHGERPTATRGVLHRLDAEDCLIDSLSSITRLSQNTLDELELIKRRPRMLRRALNDQILYLRPTQRRHPRATQRSPHFRLLLIELQASITQTSRRTSTREMPVDLLPQRCRLHRRSPTDLAELQIEIDSFGRFACRDSLSRKRCNTNLIGTRATLADTHAASPRPSSHSSTALSG